MAINENRPVRASGELAFHVFEIMDAINRAAKSDKYQTIISSCQQPEPLPKDFPLNSIITKE